MTSSISAISAVGGLDAVQGIQGVDGLTPTTGTAAAQGPNEDFTSMLSKGLQSVQDSQTNADNLAVQVADGTLKDPAQYTMAATEASLGLQLTLAIRNKAVEAFQEIMRMQA
jgi:flagellar hook-basal body complex protein FliE